ncbi:TPA: 50S ribosomal protein L24 [Candidatus Micrarchaeota archaeon]|nr:50S ribosomal protein L24 [Candidatus Micrarchaeota archaeon]HIH29826.1 50S ribosomal protein L24 [Candidatus Micrarchaeota archaeon]
MFMDSIQARKQRKFRYDAPLHLRRKMASSHLSKELRAKLSTRKRNAPLHKGDKVKVMRGGRKGHVGKVIEVDLSNLKAYVEGVSQRTAKGVEKLMPIDPSNLLIMEGEFTKDRLEMIKRSGKAKANIQG